MGAKRGGKRSSEACWKRMRKCGEVNLWQCSSCPWGLLCLRSFFEMVAFWRAVSPSGRASQPHLPSSFMCCACRSHVFGFCWYAAFVVPVHGANGPRAQAGHALLSRTSTKKFFDVLGSVALKSRRLAACGSVPFFAPIWAGDPDGLCVARCDARQRI